MNSFAIDDFGTTQSLYLCLPSVLFTIISFLCWQPILTWTTLNKNPEGEKRQLCCLGWSRDVGHRFCICWWRWPRPCLYLSGFPLILDVLPPERDKSICIKYGGRVISLHEFLFSLIGFRLPSNAFEVGIINHLVIYPSQLHLISCAYIIVL